jgi:CHAT domain-containing protein/Tfp pilus assembly protein PilF
MSGWMVRRRLALLVCFLTFLPVLGWAQDREALERANQLNQQVVQLYQQGKYTQAIPLAKEALRIREQALGPTHPAVATSLNNLALLLKTTGDYAGAKPLFERALRINEQALGPTHPDVATSLNNLAGLLQATGDYAGAKPLYERALRLYEQALGPTHPAVATSLNDLAELMRATGDYAGAKPLYERALRLYEQALGPTHPDVATSLNNLALVLWDTGDYAGARPLYERALRIREQALGPTHPYVATSLNNLAGLLQATGDYAGAKPLYERALRLYEQALGPTHPDVATSLNDLAELMRATGDYAGAKPLYERALRIYEQALGPTHPDVATSLNNLAGLLQDTGDYAGAKPLYERALRIHEQALGPTHPDVATSLNNLALALWDSGDSRSAMELLARAVSIVERNSRQGLLGMAERQKLAFLRTTASPVQGYLSLPSVPPAAAYAAILARKNLVFQVLAEERAALTRAEDPAVRDRLARRAQLVAQLTRLVHGSGGDPNVRRERAAAIEQAIEQVEAELSRQSAAFRAEQAEARTGAADVCAALPTDTVLLDFFRYHRYSPHQGNQPGKWTDSYTVFLLRGGQCGQVQRVELGPAAPIDAAAHAFRQAVAEGATDAGLRPKAKALGEVILPPIVRQALAGASLVLVAPDGPVALVPFGLLPGDKEQTFLLESSPLVTIPSGRDVLRASRGQAPPQTAEPVPGVVLVGNPDYGATVMVAQAAGDSRRATVRAGCGLESGDTFSPLPGTGQEVAAIAKTADRALPQAAVRRAEQQQATEAWLAEQITGQRYAHLATHGYFAGEQCAPQAGPAGRGVKVESVGLQDESSGPIGTNPLLLSGIALAGANHRAQATSGADDGILTALEVTGLDLRGTDLVVLSACETGLGTVQTGQELMGLRWAFNMAGAKSLVTSLWKVPDEPTVQLMTKFYGYLWQSPKDGGTPGKAAALRQAQLDLMKENRARYNGDSRPNDWGAWVLSGDWR